MKKIILVALLTSAFSYSFAQNRLLESERISAKDSLKLAGKWVKGISKDSSFAASSHDSLTTQKAIQQYIDNHLLYFYSKGVSDAKYLTQAQADALYAALSHTHTIANITSLQAALDAKLAIVDTINLKPRLKAGSNVTITGTYPSLTITAIDTAATRTYYKYTTRYPYDIKVWQNSNDTTYHTNYDWDEVKNRIPNSTVYIDPVNGKDSATKGTFAAPLKTLRYVLDSTTYQDWKLKSGSYFGYTEGLQNAEVTRDVKMSVYGGTVKPKVTVAKYYTWTLDPASGGTTWYTNETTNTGMLFDTTNKDEYGNYIPLKYGSSTSVVYANTNTYRHAGDNNIYVHTIDGRQPDSSIIVSPQAHAFRSSTSPAKNYYLEGIEFWGGNDVISIHNDDTLNTKNMVARNCNFYYSYGDGVSVKGNSFVAFDHCNLAYTNDNHDYSPSATYTKYSPTGFEYYSFSTHATDRVNQSTLGSAENGSTAHGSSKVLRVGGFYGSNEGRNVADIDSTLSVNIGLKSYYSIAFYDTSKVGFAPGNIESAGTLAGRAGNFTQLINCTSVGNYRAIQIGYNAIVDTFGFVYTEPLLINGQVRSIIKTYNLKAVGQDTTDGLNPALSIKDDKLTIKGGNTVIIPETSTSRLNVLIDSILATRSIDTVGVAYSRGKILAANVTTTLATAATTGLDAPLVANKKYRVVGYLPLGCSSTGGVKFSVSVPTGTTVNIGFFGSSTTNALGLFQTLLAGSTLTTTAHARVASTTATQLYVKVDGYITVGSTAGTLTLNFASGTAAQTSTIFAGAGLDVTLIQ